MLSWTIFSKHRCSSALSDTMMISSRCAKQCGRISGPINLSINRWTVAGHQITRTAFLQTEVAPARALKRRLLCDYYPLTQTGGMLNLNRLSKISLKMEEDMHHPWKPRWLFDSQHTFGKLRRASSVLQVTLDSVPRCPWISILC